jgi:hypothetical protein
MDSALAVIVGIGLAASCGFRVFVPLLVCSVAANAGYLELAEGFQWIGTWAAFAAFAVAATVEVAAYYVPWLDNLLDTIASPAGMIAGVILFAASVTDLDPLLHWSLALIAGGGAAGIVQGGTVVTRVAYTTSNGGVDVRTGGWLLFLDAGDCCARRGNDLAGCRHLRNVLHRPFRVASDAFATRYFAEMRTP